MISMNSGIICLNALTIAGRYLFVRRQFGNEQVNNTTNNNDTNNNSNNNTNNNFHNNNNNSTTFNNSPS